MRGRSRTSGTPALIPCGEPSADPDGRAPGRNHCTWWSASPAELRKVDYQAMDHQVRRRGGLLVAVPAPRFLEPRATLQAWHHCVINQLSPNDVVAAILISDVKVIIRDFAFRGD